MRGMELETIFNFHDKSIKVSNIINERSGARNYIFNFHDKSIKVSNIINERSGAGNYIQFPR